MIVADGPLHQLPFGALLTESINTTYLLDRWSFTLLPSGTFYHHKQEPKKPAQWSLLMVGAPYQYATNEKSTVNKREQRQGEEVFLALIQERGSDQAPPETGKDLQGYVDLFPEPNRHLATTWLQDFNPRRNQLGPLPFSSLEVETIAHFFPEAERRVFSGKNAIKSHFKIFLGQAKILHFSCHSQLNDEVPFLSALVLAQPQAGKPAERLYAWEIREAGPLSANLVVLSACETALGPAVGGNGLLSLNQAFHQAGVPSVAASLWRVSDLSTAILMTQFYQNLLQGLDKDIALKQAQMSLRHQRKGSKIDISHPYWWAGFQLYGLP